MTRVDIGVFAHNEASSIVRMLGELLRQETTELDLRILILANGCTDDTVTQARSFVPSEARSNIQIEVIDLPLGGKSRTWNRFVHDLSRPEAEVLIFSDADITIPAPDSLLRLVQGLLSNPKLYAFNSHPVKDIVHRPQNLSLMDKAIAMGSETLTNWKKAICGSLYAMPASRARALYMPIGLAVEDGFLRAMILTDVLTIDEDFSRIDGGDVFHIFASERSVLALIRHQTRIVIGSAVNAAAFAALRELPVDQRRSALAQASGQEAWLSDVIRSRLPQWPFGWIPQIYLTKRIRFIAAQPRNLLHPQKLFVLVMGFAFDLVVYVNAQIKMARGTGAGHW